MESTYSGYSYYFGGADLQDPEVYTSSYEPSELAQIRHSYALLSQTRTHSHAQVRCLLSLLLLFLCWPQCLSLSFLSALLSNSLPRNLILPSANLPCLAGFSCVQRDSVVRDPTSRSLQVIASNEDAAEVSTVLRSVVWGSFSLSLPRPRATPPSS
jgi:hypothetical protein